MTDRSNSHNPFDGEHPENQSGSSPAGNHNVDGVNGGFESGLESGQSGYPSYGQTPNEPGTAGTSFGKNSNSFGGNNAFGKATDATYGATGYTTGSAYPSGAEAYDATGGYPGGAYPGQYQEKNNMALWAMILGIIAFVLTLTIIGAMFGLGIVLGLVAVVLGILGIRRAGKMVGPNRRKGMAIAGIVLGALSIIASIAVFLGLFGFANWFADTGIMEACQPFLDANDQAGYEKCIEEEAANIFQ